MKTFTNYTPGTRGIRTEGGMVWIDPGQSARLDPDKIIGEVPDLGSKSSAPAEPEFDAGDIDLLNSTVADLTDQVAKLTAERDGLAKDKADLTDQVAKLTKPTK